VLSERSAAGEGIEELVLGELRQDLARRLNVDPREVKPCLARVGAVDEGIRNETAYIVATEYRRMGAAEAVAWGELSRWNRRCRPPLTEVELRGVLKSAWAGPETYGCRGKLAELYCVGQEKCSWYATRMAKRKRRVADEVCAFIDAGWPALLKSAEVRVYVALLRLEKLRGVGAGAVIIASTRDYAALAGVARGKVLAALDGLERRGLLVVLDRGQRRGAGLPPRACQVVRASPIPEAPVGETNRRRETLCG
jgi:hypothetical protein